jgi:hypothetical protein
MKWDNPQECQDALDLTWDEFKPLWPQRSRDSYYSYRKRSKDSPEPRPSRSPEPPWMPPPADLVTEQTITLGNKAGKRKLVINFGDMHFGDQGLLYRSWRETCDKAVSLAEQFDPSEILLNLVGDGATGRGVFRGQEMRSVLPMALPQVWWLAIEILDFINALKEACPKAKVEGFSVQGNHDMVNKESIAADLPLLLHVLGVRWQFRGRQAVFNAAAKGQPAYTCMSEHGYGHSSYYPNSYSQIRGTREDLLSRDRRMSSVSELIHRVVAGHTHWAHVGHMLAPGRFLDTVGGFQRQDRLSLPPAGRPPGFIVYLHDGQQLVAQVLGPNQKTVDEEHDDPALDIHAGITAYQRLLEVRQLLVDKGLFE